MELVAPRPNVSVLMRAVTSDPQRQAVIERVQAATHRLDSGRRMEAIVAALAARLSGWGLRDALAFVAAIAGNPMRAEVLRSLATLPGHGPAGEVYGKLLDLEGMEAPTKLEALLQASLGRHFEECLLREAVRLAVAKRVGRQEVQDVAQQALLSMLKRRGTVKALALWEMLGTAVKWRRADDLRKRGRRKADLVSDVDPDALPDSSTELRVLWRDLVERVRRAMANLPERQRRDLARKAGIAEDEPGDAAETRSTEALKRAITRARKALRVLLPEVLEALKNPGSGEP
jgi:DNA-directed RNA polymerase specialized sigma24 family protein